MLLVSVMAISALTGCGDQGGEGNNGGGNAGGSNAGSTATENNGGSEDASNAGGNTEITEFSYFITMPGSEINDDNEIAQIIAEKTGVKVKETWLTGQSAAEATGTLIAGGEYPDFIDSDDMSMLVDAHCFLWTTISINIPSLRIPGLPRRSGKSSVSRTAISIGSIPSAIPMVRARSPRTTMRLSGFR